MTWMRTLTFFLIGEQNFVPNYRNISGKNCKALLPSFADNERFVRDHKFSFIIIIIILLRQSI